jgi:hypothetical protein
LASAPNHIRTTLSAAANFNSLLGSLKPGGSPTGALHLAASCQYATQNDASQYEEPEWHDDGDND